MKFTAVICTLGRSDFLRRTVESLKLQDFPSMDFEILIVSNDPNRPNAVQGFSEPHGRPPVRVLLEPRPGLSFARNAAILSSEAQFLAFLDDDAEAAPSWLSSLWASFSDNDSAAMAGGKVLPLWEAPKPRWLVEPQYRHMSLLDLGEAPRVLRWPDHLIGANMAFRRSALEGAGAFRTDLGRRDGLLFGNEDTEIQERLHEAGMQVLYEPRAVVHHLVPAWRMRRGYILKRIHWAGRSSVFTRGHQGNGGQSFPWVALRELVGGVVKLTANPFSRRRRRKYFHRIAFQSGVFRQKLWALRKSPEALKR